jgi:hypothetical protein
MIADELRRQADTFLELGELASLIQREHRGPAVAPMDDDEEEDSAPQQQQQQRPTPRSGRYYQPA